MDDGIAQEVRLHRMAEGEYRLEIIFDSETASIPILQDQLLSLLDSREMRVEVPSWRCIVTAADDLICFDLSGTSAVRFSMPRNQFSALTKGLGLPAHPI